LQGSGKYTIFIIGFEANRVGAFTVSLSLRDSTPGLASPAPTRIAGCPATVDGALTASSSRRGWRGEHFYTSVYEFPGRRGQIITVDIPQASFDTFLYLMGPAGGIYAQNDDFGGTSRSRLEGLLTDTGTYRVEVTSFEARVTGTFRLAVTGCTPVAN
jgi:hypothetical protein